MATVAVVGSGYLGSAVRRALVDRGCEVLSLSRSTGFDITTPVSFAGHGRIDAVVEATNAAALGGAKAGAFFTASTTHIDRAAAEAGIGLHVLVSIVGCSRPAVSGFGYYAAKAAQERAALRGQTPTAIVRSTQWFEFARQNLGRMGFGPFAFIPRMLVQPVALDAVADVVAQRTLGERTEDRIELCGPERTTVDEMIRALPDAPRFTIGFPVPGTAGRAFRTGALLPDAAAEVVGPTYAQWLAASR